MTTLTSHTGPVRDTLRRVTDGRTDLGRNGAIALVGAAALVLGVALAQVVDLVGPLLLAVPLVGVIGWYLVGRPGVAFGALVASAIIFEDSGDALFGLATDTWYRYLGPTPVIAADFLLGCTVVAIAVAGARAPQPGEHPRAHYRLLGPFTVPLLLLAVATLWGMAVGFTGGANPVGLISSSRNLGYLVVVPFVGAAVLTDADQRRKAVGVVAGLILAKCAVGVVAYMMGEALVFGGESGQLIYYEAPMNFLMVIYLVAVVIALMVKVPVPRWILIGWPLVLVTLGLSFRRSFWIAGVLSLALAALVASGRRGRPWVLLAGAALAIALWSVLAAGQSTDTDNPIVERAQSINPSQVRQSTGDRYRLDEQKNVIAEIRQHPITGIGLGVPWTARSPLSEEHTGGRYYTHVTVLWYWLNTGPMGLIAYLWLTITTIWAGLQVWRRAPEPWARVVALALAVSSIGLAVAETTGSFSGINFRFTVVLGACIAWLASALADAPDDRGQHRGADLPTEIGERPTAAL